MAIGVKLWNGSGGSSCEVATAQITIADGETVVGYISFAPASRFASGEMKYMKLSTSSGSSEDISFGFGRSIVSGSSLDLLYEVDHWDPTENDLEENICWTFNNLSVNGRLYYYITNYDNTSITIDLRCEAAGYTV